MERLTQLARPRAFSLLELLMVMAVMALLIGVAGQSLSHGSGAMQLTGAADATMAMFTQARLLASSTNQTHEVLIGQWEAGGDERLGLFIYRVTVDDGAVFTGEAHVFDAGIRIAEGMTTVFDGRLPEASEPPPIHQEGARQSRQVRIEIHPSGATSLGDEELQLTLTTRADSLRADGPRNFVMFLIDPHNATLRSLRPN